MHTFLVLASLLATVLVSSLLLRSQPRWHSWWHRRLVQVVVLTMPLLSVGVSACDLHHVFAQPCFTASPFWDDLLGTVLAVTLLTMVLGALLWGGVRWMLMHVLLARVGAQTGDPLQRLVEECAQRAGICPPVVRRLRTDQPLAWTSGWGHPWMVVSTWMEEHLDQRELEAVIMHELAHVIRQDAFALWAGKVLRDAFWYLPTSRAAYHQLEQDKEVACDDLAVEITHRPLALASALTKVWLQGVENTPSTSSYGVAHHLEGTRQQMAARIERLMAQREQTLTARVTAPSGLSVLSALGTVEIIVLLLLFAAMACGPLFFLARWV